MVRSWNENLVNFTELFFGSNQDVSKIVLNFRRTFGFPCSARRPISFIGISVKSKRKGKSKNNYNVKIMEIREKGHTVSE